MWVLLLLAALPLGEAVALELPASLWSLRTSRMEGAAVSAREAAAAARFTAESIAAAGRVQSVATLHSQAVELNRKVVSARLAAEQLDRAE